MDNGVVVVVTGGPVGPSGPVIEPVIVLVVGPAAGGVILVIDGVAEDSDGLGVATVSVVVVVVTDSAGVDNGEALVVVTGSVVVLVIADGAGVDNCGPLVVVTGPLMDTGVVVVVAVKDRFSRADRNPNFSATHRVLTSSGLSLQNFVLSYMNDKDCSCDNNIIV